LSGILLCFNQSALEESMNIRGLSQKQVAEKKAAGLINDYEPRKTKSIPVIIIKNIFIIFNILLAPLLVILLLMKQYKDVFSVGGVALLNTLINITQEIQAKLALDRIKMEHPPMALVVREGETQEIPTRSIVQGDYLLLRSGELALADGSVVESSHLEMDESMLTGESDYIPKPGKAEILSGSFAVTGEGVYIAEKIGQESYMQKVVAQSRKSVSKVTPLEHKVNILVNTFMVFCFLIAGALVLKFQPFSGTMVEPIRFIVASVTSLIPQGLVLIVTITFALGVIAFAKQGIIFQKINAVEALSNVNLICMDKTGTLTHNRIEMGKALPFKGVTAPQLKQALGDFASSVSEKNKTMEAIASSFKSKGCISLDEVPFKSKNKFSAVRVKRAGRSYDMIIGAYEMLVPRLNKHDQQEVLEKIVAYEKKGIRTIVIARKTAGRTKLKNSLKNFKLMGILTFSEEIKKEAPKILKGFAKKGVRQVVISGDSLTTVQSIAARIGLKNVEHGITGVDLGKLSGKAFTEKVLETTVFARISPEQKRDIIKTFKAAGYYTSMVGDGVNDVLALKQANLAIAMGSGGSMAKDVADIVLVNNKFDVLPGLLEEGDKIVSRIQDCARIFTLKNFYALMMIIAILSLGITFPFFPQQITLINFITITIPLLYLIKFSNYKTKVEKSFLMDILRFSATFGMLIAVTAIGINFLYTNVFKDVTRHVQTAAMFPVVILASVSFLYLINRAHHIGQIAKDKIIFFISIGLISLFFIAMHIEPLRKFFEIVPFTGRDWLVTSAFTIPALIVQSFLMKWYMKRQRIKS